MSLSELRYQEVVDNLAVIAHNSGTMPSFAFSSGGTTAVTNLYRVDSSTTFTHAALGFSNQLLSFLGQHNPDENWTICTASGGPIWEGLHYACMWQLYGPPAPNSPAMELLRAPRIDDRVPKPGNVNLYHLDVARYLEDIPPGWLGHGCEHDVPKNACYSSHCHGTYVWVLPEGMPGLSEFTLVVMDILTTDPSTLAVLPVHVLVVTKQCKDCVGKPDDAKLPEVTEVWNAQQQTPVNGTPGTITITRPPLSGIPTVEKSDLSAPSSLNPPVQRFNLQRVFPMPLGSPSASPIP
jgi:hypothetical protein